MAMALIKQRENGLGKKNREGGKKKFDQVFRFEVGGKM